MEKKLVIHMMFFLAMLCAQPEAGEFDLSIEEIIDSNSFLQKIKQPDNQLYSFFRNCKTPVTRNNIVDIINKNVLQSTDFAYSITNFSELKTEQKFEDLDNNKKNEFMVRNRDLLSELFPDEIAPRSKETIKQAFGLNIPIQKIDSLSWLKAEMVNFLNEIMTNENVLQNWEMLKAFFDSTVKDELIKRFADELRACNMQKIPVNAIEVQKIKSSNMANISITSKNDMQQKDLLAVSLVPGKKWKICKVDNINKCLFQAGYGVKKEVQQ